MKRTPDLSDELLRTAAKSAGNNELKEYKEKSSSLRTNPDKPSHRKREHFFRNLHGS